MIASAHPIRLILILAGAVLAVGVALGLWVMLAGGSPPLPPEEEPPRAPVKWMAARQMFAEEWTDVFGTTQPLPTHAARITAPLEGRVVSVLQGADGKPVVEGQVVKKGDLIVQLDATLAKANRDKAEAGLKELGQLTKQAELAAKLADIDVKRLTELNKNTSTTDPLPLVSRIELEKAKLALEDAEAKVKAAEFREVTGKRDLEAMDKQLLLYSLTAPIDGRLGRVLVIKGQTLASGTLVSDVVNVEDEIDVLCFVPPHVAKRLQDGQPARLGAVDKAQREAELRQLGLSSSTSEGKVVFIAAQAEVDTGNFAVKVRFPNQDLKLRSNTTLRLRVQTNPGKACWTLPESAVFEDQDPPSVIVVEDHQVVKTKEGKEMEIGKARKLVATLGIRDHENEIVEIVSVRDPENKWKGKLDDSTLFVYQRGQGLRTDDLIRLEVDED
jgi:RND family efflux transporter MFP subunit